MIHCPDKLLKIFDKLDENKIFSPDCIMKNQVAGFSSRELKILDNQGLSTYLSNIVGDSYIALGMLLHSTNPYSIHTDYQKDQDYEDNCREPSEAILIPLQTLSVHTIVFNQQATNNDQIEKLPDIQDHVTNVFWQKNLTHCDEYLKTKVSVKSYNSWQRGQPIVWHRKDLHCSDNFVQNNISIKKAVVFFMYKKTDHSCVN